MKKMTLITVTMILLTACGGQVSEAQKPLETVNCEMSQGEQLKERLMSLGDNAIISSDEDMEALWNYLTNTEPSKDVWNKPKWQMTDNCYLTIVAGRGAIKLVEDDVTVTFKFVTTIDCPTRIDQSEISFIVSKVSDTYEMGTYTDGNARWFLGEVSN